MINRINNKTPKTIFFFIVATIVSSYLLFYISYSKDNRYTFGGPKADKGILILDSNILEENPCFFLVEGWEIYRDKLLKPEDFSTNHYIPDEYVFIGQYGGLEGAVDKGNYNANPHGSVTYRINIKLPPSIKNYTLELPEIYSAYKLFLNGDLVAQYGNPDPKDYVPQTKISKISFQASNRLELIFNVSDFDNIYSGMIYPPLFGYTEPVEKMINLSIAIRFLGISLTLTIAIFNLIIYYLTKDNIGFILPLYFSILSIFYIIYISYPIVKTIFNIGMWWYNLKNISFTILFFIIVLIQNKLIRFNNIFSHGIISLSIFTIVFGLTVHLLNHNSYSLMVGYSKLLKIYLWIVSLYLLLTSFYSQIKNIEYYKSMLLAQIVFAVSSLMDRLFPLFQHIYWGTFTEISGFIFIISIGAVVLTEISSQFKLKLLLENKIKNINDVLEIQKVLFPVIIEKEEEIKKINHDLRHHMTIIHQFILDKNYIKLKEYVESLSKTTSIHFQKSFCSNYIIDMILRLYYKLAEDNKITIYINANIPNDLDIDDLDICVIISNILENALEASLKIPIDKRIIQINIKYKMNHLGIFVKNAFDGIPVKNIGIFIPTKSKSNIGLISVNDICKKYNGSLHLSNDNFFFYTEVFLPLNRKDE